jgi:hypothetical protein
VDDVAIKTSHPNTLITGLEETFALREYQWKLIPNKCVLSVPSGQLLRFITRHRGIEANFKKVTAITSMFSPTTIKDIQKLTWFLEALNPFISRLRGRGLPFCKLLNWQEKFMWTEEVDHVLQQLKDFLSKHLILTAPQAKEELLLCIAMTTHAVSTAIIIERQEDGYAYKVQRPVYFISEVLSESKVRYLLVHKLLYAILIISRKL